MKKEQRNVFIIEFVGILIIAGLSFIKKEFLYILPLFAVFLIFAYFMGNSKIRKLENPSSWNLMYKEELFKSVLPKYRELLKNKDIKKGYLIFRTGLQEWDIQNRLR